MNEIYLLLAVLLGFYLAKFNEVNQRVKEEIKKLKAIPKGYAEDNFVIRTDEVALEEKQKREQNKERIYLKDILE